jgi:hypothetical protein
MELVPKTTAISIETFSSVGKGFPYCLAEGNQGCDIL